MFLTEQDLRDTFWANYNYNNRAIKYQFECPLRQGNIDLVTVEKFQEQYQINAFEFKLDDMKKLLPFRLGAGQGFSVLPLLLTSFFDFGDKKIYYTHNSGHIEKWVTRFLDTLPNQIPVNGQIPK